MHGSIIANIASLHHLLHFTAYDVSLLNDLEQLPADEKGKGDDYSNF